MWKIRDETTLADALAALDRSQLDRPLEMIREAARHSDYVFRETLKVRLEASPREHSPSPPRIWAKMPLGGRHVYQLVTDEREVGLHFEESHGVGIAHHRHRVYSLIDGDRRVGRIDYFPNNGFVFINKEPCLCLSVIDLEGRRWYQYRADTAESWWKASAYSVFTDEGGELVAIATEGSGWFLPRRHLKLYQPHDHLDVALMMAVHHGLVFRQST